MLKCLYKYKKLIAVLGKFVLLFLQSFWRKSETQKIYFHTLPMPLV